MVIFNKGNSQQSDLQKAMQRAERPEAKEIGPSLEALQTSLDAFSRKFDAAVDHIDSEIEAAQQRLNALEARKAELIIMRQGIEAAQGVVGVCESDDDGLEEAFKRADDEITEAVALLRQTEQPV